MLSSTYCTRRTTTTAAAASRRYWATTTTTTITASFRKTTTPTATTAAARLGAACTTSGSCTTTTSTTPLLLRGLSSSRRRRGRIRIRRTAGSLRWFEISAPACYCPRLCWQQYYKYTTTTKATFSTLDTTTTAATDDVEELSSAKKGQPSTTTAAASTLQQQPPVSSSSDDRSNSAPAVCVVGGGGGGATSACQHLLLLKEPREVMTSLRIYRYLDLHQFTREEIEEVFERIASQDYPTTNPLCTSAAFQHQSSSSYEHHGDDEEHDDKNTNASACATAAGNGQFAGTRIRHQQQQAQENEEGRDAVFKITAEDAATMTTPQQHPVVVTAAAPAPARIGVSQVQQFLLERIYELEEEGSRHLETIREPDALCAVPVGAGPEGRIGAADEIAVALLRTEYAATEAKRLLKVLRSNCSGGATTGASNGGDGGEDVREMMTTLTKEEFVEALETLAGRVDYRRVSPVALSMLLVGSSVGIMTPAMPFVVESLGISASQFGMVVSAFGLAKMLGNVPAAVAVERHGRKPHMIWSLAIVAAGVSGVGLAGGFEDLFVSRFCTGIGVALLTTASTMMITDLSTPRNRASTFAPVMSMFSAGTAIGPAAGGVLVDMVGYQPTFLVVGAGFVSVAALNRWTMVETKQTLVQFPWQRPRTRQPSREKDVVGQDDTVRGALSNAVGQWMPLLRRNPAARNVIVMNGFYWMALAGSQMTLLPLILTDPNGLAMSATGVGQCYMGMSTIQIVGNPIFAAAADRLGRAPAIVAGCALISASMAALPYACQQGIAATAAGGGGQDLAYLAAALASWSVGSSMLSAAPTAYLTDLVSDDESQRSQALALLRTAGDVGLLLGATGAGALADWSGSLDVAMESNAAVLCAATAWFTARLWLDHQIKNSNLNKPAAHHQPQQPVSSPPQLEEMTMNRTKKQE